MKNKAQPDRMPVWFDGKSINEALFCEEFLQTHKIIFTNGAFFTPEDRVTDELPLRGEVFEDLKCCEVSNIPRKISNIVELTKLAALAEDFPPEPDRIHLANGTLFLDGGPAPDQLCEIHCHRPGQDGFGAQGQTELSGMDVRPAVSILQRRFAGAV